MNKRIKELIETVGIVLAVILAMTGQVTNDEMYMLQAISVLLLLNLIK
jgi:hypothetical protein